MIGGNKLKYKNVKTGAIISSPCKIGGENWIEYTNEVEITKNTETEQTETKETDGVKGKEESTINGITKKQIMQELDAMGIEYNPKDKKEELYNLMLGE